ncbi:MAG: twin-arginine translocase TatA/TatE family subunit [Desulfovibrio sp.]|nr:twin-arginine translocase TatA/TatE family subunit [Desulfovibrio sp.]
MFSIGPAQILIILLIVLVLFGAKKLPEIGGGLGKAIRNFRKATTEPDEIDITEQRKKEEPEKKTDQNQ